VVLNGASSAEGLRKKVGNGCQEDDGTDVAIGFILYTLIRPRFTMVSMIYDGTLSCLVHTG
jgi:hypothetical protein